MTADGNQGVRQNTEIIIDKKKYSGGNKVTEILQKLTIQVVQGGNVRDDRKVFEELMFELRLRW